MGEAACVPSYINLLIRSGGMGDTKDYVSKARGVCVLKKQQEKCNQHKIKAHPLSGFCS